MDEKELLINSIVIAIADNCNLPIKELREIITNEFYNYAVIKTQCNLPSTKDGSTTRFLMQEFSKIKIAQGMEKRTLEQYIMVIKQLYNFCQKEINLIDYNDINNFIISLRYKGLQDSSIKSKYALLSSIYKFLFDYKYIAENPMNKVTKVKYVPRLKKPLNSKEIELIKIVCEKQKCKSSRRTYAMILFMLDSGVRVSELCNMKIKDIDFENLSAVVYKGKGKKDREVYFTDRTLIRINEYFEDRDDIQITVNGMSYPIDAPLFASLDKEHHNLTPCAIRSKLNEVGEESGVTRIHPHLLRATFATRLAENGVPINIIAQLLGHANLHTIDRYILLSKKKIRELIDKVTN